jgi:hypothetical protein
MEENKELLEQTCDCGEDCQCEELENDALIQLTLDKEYDRLSRRFLYDEDKLIKLSERKEFQEGVSEGLRICGLYSTLVSFGIDETNVMDIILNKMNIDHNILTTKISNEASIEVSKNQSITLDKTNI